MIQTREDAERAAWRGTSRALANGEPSGHGRRHQATWPREADVRPLLGVQIELTQNCTQRCSYCLNASEPGRPVEASRELVDRVLDEFLDLGLLTLVVSGGEPLLADTFWHLVESAGDGVRLVLNTNGARLTPEAVRRLARIPFCTVNINVEGGTPDIHDAVRGPGSFASTCAALDLLAATNLHSRVVPGTVITRVNHHAVSGLCRLLAGWGYTRWRIIQFMPVGRGALNDQLALSSEELRGCLGRVVRESGARGITPLLSHCLDVFRHAKLPANTMPACEAGTSSLCIDALGQVWPCAYLRGPEWLVGRLERSSLAELWRTSPVLGRLRAFRAAGCVRCAVASACRGGCKAWIVRTAGDLRGKDPRCAQLRTFLLGAPDRRRG